MTHLWRASNWSLYYTFDVLHRCNNRTSVHLCLTIDNAQRHSILSKIKGLTYQPLHYFIVAKPRLRYGPCSFDSMSKRGVKDEFSNDVITVRIHSLSWALNGGVISWTKVWGEFWVVYFQRPWELAWATYEVLLILQLEKTKNKTKQF